MKKLCFAVLLLCATVGYAMPIASSARSMVPSEIQQLIGVDYRALKDSPTAQALKDKVMPQNLKDLETALKAIGIDSDHDLDQLNFASFRTEKKGIQTIGVAQGSFSAKAVLKKLKLKKISATKYGTASIYPMENGWVMTFLDDNTLAFGEPASLHSALGNCSTKASFSPCSAAWRLRAATSAALSGRNSRSNTTCGRSSGATGVRFRVQERVPSPSPPKPVCRVQLRTSDGKRVFPSRRSAISWSQEMP